MLAGVATGRKSCSASVPFVGAFDSSVEASFDPRPRHSGSEMDAHSKGKGPHSGCSPVAYSACTGWAEAYRARKGSARFVSQTAGYLVKRDGEMQLRHVEVHYQGASDFP